MRDKLFLTDIDGVVIDSLLSVLDEANRMLGTEYKETDVASWNWLTEEVARITLRDERMIQRINALWSDPEIIRRAVPVSGAIETLKNIKGLGWDVRVVTTRPTNLTDTTLDWFKQYAPWLVDKGRIYIRSGAYPLSGNDFKLYAVTALNPDLYVDDRGETITYLLGNTDSETATSCRLFNRRWNEDFSDLNAVRIASWEKVWESTK